jgi:hypothetical protein
VRVPRKWDGFQVEKTIDSTTIIRKKNFSTAMTTDSDNKAWHQKHSAGLGAVWHSVEASGFASLENIKIAK